MFKRIVIISILPVILFLTGLHYRHQLIVYHISTVDPEYAYLYNGLNIARLNFHLGHIDHPGTPVQMTVAFTIRVVHLFSGQGLLSDDVMKNPEKYLLASNLVLIILITVALFVLGYFVERITKNLALSFLIQLSPFSSYIVMVALGRVTPEPMLLVAVILLIAMSFIYLYSNNEQKQTKHTLFLESLPDLVWQLN